MQQLLVRKKLRSYFYLTPRPHFTQSWVEKPAKTYFLRGRKFESPAGIDLGALA